MKTEKAQGRRIKTNATGVYRYVSAKGETTYHIAYKDSRGRLIWEAVGTQIAGCNVQIAAQIRAERIHQTKRGEPAPIAQKRQERNKATFAMLSNAYFIKIAGKSSFKTYKSIYQYLSPLDDKLADEVKGTDIEGILNRQEHEGKAAQTLNHILTLCRVIYNYGIKQGAIKDNPTKDIEKRQTDNERQGYLNPAECRLLIDEVTKSGDQELLLFVLLALSTGARVSTINAIRGVDCDLEKGVMRLKNIKVDRSYNAYITGELRPLLEKAISELKTPYHYVIGGNEKPRNYRTPSKNLQSYLDRLFNKPKGINKSDRTNRLVTHSLRHSFASNLAIEGVSPLSIMQLLDHSNLELTKRYSKIADEAKREAVAELMNKIGIKK
jgi:site-specific recombinase XerD